VKNSTIRVGGKINAVSMSKSLHETSLIKDNCEGTGLVLDTLVGGLEISKSKKIQLQIMDKTPMINLDHVDQATIYLSKAGLGVEIVTSSTTGVNVRYLSRAMLTFRFWCRIRRKRVITLSVRFRKVYDTSSQITNWSVRYWNMQDKLSVKGVNYASLATNGE
jgi:hypothetical protein